MIRKNPDGKLVETQVLYLQERNENVVGAREYEHPLSTRKKSGTVCNEMLRCLNE